MFEISWLRVKRLCTAARAIPGWQRFSMLKQDRRSLNSLGRYEEAVRLYKGTVGITERALGREHPDTLNCRDRLANAYRDLER